MPLSQFCERGILPSFILFLCEGLAVGALIHSGIALVSADKDFIQGAVIVGCVVTAACHGAFNAGVAFTIHCTYLHFSKYKVSISTTASNILDFNCYFLVKKRSRNSPDGKARIGLKARLSACSPLSF